MSRFADVVLPLAQPAYTFVVPDDMALREGQAVAVQFGGRAGGVANSGGGGKISTGIVWRIHDRRPDFKRIKPILKTLYPTPVLSAEQRRFWEWIADYYLCSVGEVMRAALPSMMKPSGEGMTAFTEDEFRQRTEPYISLCESLADESALSDVLDALARRAKRQYAALLDIADKLRDAECASGEVARRLIDADRGVLTTLAAKGYIKISEHVPSAEVHGKVEFRLPVLSDAQQRALEALKRGFQHHKTMLLQGITGSGKTEIYIHLIAQTLSCGGDALLLLPEIALTAQLIERMESIFGSRVTPYHSKLTDRKRAETYLRLGSAEGGELVVGVRSSIFLPLRHLQLVIVDEEHDAGYKQSEPSPRYNARDCSSMLSQIFGGQTLLGSATPSLESWMNAESGKYGKVLLSERYGEAVEPHIFISDTIRAVKRGERHTHFNKLLLDKMSDALERHEQIMLFQNRRGFSPYVECRECGWTARCPNCNVTLTLHKGANRLVCHYCGHAEPVPAKCPSCKVTDVVPMGFGTEKVEEEISKVFPAARVVRLDRDSVTSERAFTAIVNTFEHGDADIMVGTQMITKGFDFGGVSLVGILNADNMLNNPDFRSSERAFQLMMQVAGRAGRRSVEGEVVIQTSQPEHPLLQQVTAADYDAMARTQLAERQMFFYPPYSRLIAITMRHSDSRLLRDGAWALGAALRAKFGRRVLGPTTPPVDKIRGEYLQSLLLKIESGASASKARAVLRDVLLNFAKEPDYKSVVVICNVDPQ